MQKKLFISLALLMFCSFGASIHADSPLTSTDFYKAYENDPFVVLVVQTNTAANRGRLSDKVMEYLASADKPIAVKLAAINAVGWQYAEDNSNRQTLFVDYIMKRYGYTDWNDMFNRATGETLICVAYLDALGRYLKVDENLVKLAQQARKKSPESFAVNIVGALIESQKRFHDGDWNGCYNVVDAVRQNKTLKNDMNEAARKIVFEYMDMYKPATAETGTYEDVSTEDPEPGDFDDGTVTEKQKAMNAVYDALSTNNVQYEDIYPISSPSENEPFYLVQVKNEKNVTILWLHVYMAEKPIVKVWDFNAKKEMTFSQWKSL